MRRHPARRMARTLTARSPQGLHHLGVVFRLLLRSGTAAVRRLHHFLQLGLLRHRRCCLGMAYRESGHPIDGL